MSRAAMRLTWVILLLTACAKLPPKTELTEVPQDDKPEVSCPLELTFDARGNTYRSVFVAGEFNKWKDKELQLTDPDGDFLFTGRFDLPNLKPGRYAYKFVVDKGKGPEWIFDPVNTRRKKTGTDDNSLLIVKDCRLPTLTLDKVDVAEDGAVITVQVKDGLEATPWNTLQAQTTTGEDVEVRRSGNTVVATLSGYPNTKIGVLIALAGEELYVPVWTRQDDFSFDKSTLYFAFTDRFANGDTSNDAPAACLPADSMTNWLGGDWAGLTQKVEAGYFDELGVDVLWISAPNDNPDGCYKGGLSRQYTAYHAYFPTSLTEPELHFGTGEELRALVDAAHARGIRVLIDFVANHVHEESALVSTHKDWFHQLFLCGWEKPIECWFEPYLPDFNYAVDGAVEAQVASAMHWIKAYDLDGFRVDAAKHIGHGFVHTLRAEIAAQVEHRPRLELPAKTYDFYTVGETFTGAWAPGDDSQVELIREWISKEELSGQFDFPLWYEVLWAFGKQSRPTGSIKQLLLSNVDAYGKDALVSSFIDNHDVPRFISHAHHKVSGGETPCGGDADCPANLVCEGVCRLSDTSSDKAKALGFSAARPQQPTSELPYRMAEIAYGFLVTQPAIPLVYYGDEIGMPGAGDPDNRRFMQFDGLLAPQERLRTSYGTFNKLRKEHNALRSKTLEMSGLTAPMEHLNDDTLIFLKRSDEEEILVVIDRRLDGMDTLPVWLPERIAPGTVFRDLVTGAELTSREGAIDVPMARPEIRFLVRQ